MESDLNIDLDDNLDNNNLDNYDWNNLNSDSDLKVGWIGLFYDFSLVHVISRKDIDYCKYITNKDV